MPEKNTNDINTFDFPVSAAFINLAKYPMHMIGWEWHEEIEIFVITNGSAQIRLPDKTLTLSAGQGLFLNQNLMHSVGTVEDGACALYTLRFHPSFLFGFGRTFLSSRYMTPLLSSPQLRYLILEAGRTETAELFRYIDDIIACCTLKPYAYELKVKSLLCSLWVVLLSFAEKMQKQTAVLSRQSLVDSARIKGALEFITKNYMEPITLEEIASSIHVSKSECCRCFQRSLGITPFEYLTKYRIFESTRRLLSDDADFKSVSLLAESVGFNNASYYNKLFKKYLGCTPTEYRKAMRGEIMQNPEVY